MSNLQVRLNGLETFYNQLMQRISALEARCTSLEQKLNQLYIQTS